MASQLPNYLMLIQLMAANVASLPVRMALPAQPAMPAQPANNLTIAHRRLKETASSTIGLQVKIGWGTANAANAGSAEPVFSTVISQGYNTQCESGFAAIPRPDDKDDLVDAMCLPVDDGKKPDGEQDCPADTWSCVALPAAEDVNGTGVFLEGCHFPSNSPLALQIDETPLQKTEAIEAALQLQCMHPPAVYTAQTLKDDLYDQQPNQLVRMMASLGADRPDHYLCGTPEAQRKLMQLTPQTLDTRALIASANLQYQATTGIVQAKGTDVVNEPVINMDRVPVLDCHAQYGPGYFLKSIKASQEGGNDFKYVGDCVLDTSYTGKVHQYAEPRAVAVCKDEWVNSKKDIRAWYQDNTASHVDGDVTIPCTYSDLENWNIASKYYQHYSINKDVDVFDRAEARFLDRFPVMCPKGQLLQSFQFKTHYRKTESKNPGENDYIKMEAWFGYYEYSCHDAGAYHVGGEEYEKRTNEANMVGRSNKPIADVQQMECDGPNDAIRGFQLQTQDGSRSSYKYVCVKPATSLATRELALTGEREYETALLDNSDVKILKHVGKQGEQSTILKWAATCGDIFFHPENTGYDWKPVLEHEKAADLVQYAIVGANAHLERKRDLVVTALKGGNNATAEYDAFAAHAISMKRKLEGLQGALSLRADAEGEATSTGRVWNIADQTVGLNIQQIDQLKAHLHRAYSCDAGSVGCASLNIPTFSYKVYGNELSTYLDFNNPNSLRSMAADLEAKARDEKLMDGMKRLMENDVAETVEQATGLEAQLERLQKEVKLSASQIQSAHEMMDHAAGQMNQTMDSLKTAYKAWQTNQIISAVFEVVTSIAEIVATGGVGAMSVVGKLDQMEGAIESAGKTASVAEKAAKFAEAGGKAEKYVEQFKKVSKLKQRVNFLGNFYSKLPVAFQAVALGIKSGVGCWCAVGERKFKPECTSLKKVAKSPPVCQLAFEIEKLNQAISPASIPDVGNMTERASAAALHNAANEIDEFSNQIAPMTGSYWDDQVADQTATVAIYLTGEVGGAYSAEQAQIYIKRAETYASAGKDMIAAASRFVAAHRDMNVVAAQIEANKNTKAIKEGNLEATKDVIEADGFLQMAASFKMTTVASMMYSTMRELCDALAYQDASTYFQCMDPARSDDEAAISKNDVRRFCGAFDPKYEGFRGFDAMPFSPFAKEQAISGTQAGQYLRRWFDTFHQFDSVKRILQVARSKQSASVPRWVTSRVKVLDVPDTAKMGTKTIVKHQLQSLHLVNGALNAPECDALDATLPCYVPNGTCTTASGAVVDVDEINQDLEVQSLNDRQVCYHFEDTTRDICPDTENSWAEDGWKHFAANADLACERWSVDNAANLGQMCRERFAQDNCAKMCCEKASDADPERPFGVYVTREQWDKFVQNPSEHALRFSLTPDSFQNREMMLDLNNIFVHDYQVYGDHLVNEQHKTAKYQLSIAPGASQEMTFMSSADEPITKVFVPKTSQGGTGTLDQLEPFSHWAVLEEDGQSPRCAIEDAQLQPLWSDAASVCKSSDPSIRNSPLCPTPPTWCMHEREHKRADDVLALPSLFTQWDLIVDRSELDQDAGRLTACSPDESASDAKCSNLYLRIMYSAERRPIRNSPPQCGFGDVNQ